MRTYTEYLTSLTVKALNSIAKQGGYKRYSKLRKAELVAFIAGEVLIDWDGAEKANVTAEKNIVCMYCGARFVSVAASMDHIDACDGEHADLIEARFLNLVTGGTDSERSDTYGINMAPKPVVFSAPAKVAPVSLVKVPVKAPESFAETLKAETTDDLMTAYMSMRQTASRMGATPSRLRVLGKLRNLSAELKARKVTLPRM